ncbi:hypothetical protein OG21DRAFT_140021 [Imleria badia]|nr:hypothetical protein OG21DRAFT_140021 [Imleria badia]
MMIQGIYPAPSLLTFLSVVHVKSGDTPFVLISVVPFQAEGTCTLIFDTRSQIFYNFPEFEAEPVRSGYTLQ